MNKVHLPTRWGGRASGGHREVEDFVGRKPGWGRGFAQCLALMLLAACNQGPTALAPGGVVSGARQLVSAPDYVDQPSFSARTNRLPVLSLQSLFHPTYVVPNDPSRVRTLLVTGDVIPSRGVNFYATQRHDFLWPFRPAASHPIWMSPRLRPEP